MSSFQDMSRPLDAIREMALAMERLDKSPAEEETPIGPLSRTEYRYHRLPGAPPVVTI